MKTKHGIFIQSFYFSIISDEKYIVQRIYSFDNDFVPWGCQSYMLGDFYYSNINRTTSLEYPLYVYLTFKSEGAFMPDKKIKVEVDVNLFRKDSSDLKKIKKIIIFFPGSIDPNSDNKNDFGFVDTGNIVLDIPIDNNIEGGINIKGSSEIKYGVSGDYRPFYMVLQGENNTYEIDSEEKVIYLLTCEDKIIKLSTCEENVIDCPLIKI